MISHTHTNTHKHTHTHNDNNKTILKEKSGSNDNNNKRKVRECHSHNPQPTPDAKRKRKRTKIRTCKIYIYIIFFFYFFQHIKMSKAFTLEKSQKNAFCLWHVRLFILLFMAYAEPVYSLFRTPTLPYRAQPLLYATGKMFLNWGLDCMFYARTSINCLPSFGRMMNADEQ